MSKTILAGNIGFLQASGSAVIFTDDSPSGTAPAFPEFLNELGIALWGEDNRFPQNVINQMDGYGLGKSALDWKARMLYGGGIVPGFVKGYVTGKGEVFEPADVTTHSKVYDFINSPQFNRFMIEYLQDWTWFNNAFPEFILANDCETITGLVHQESCDCRLQQADQNGKTNKVFLSKFWGMAKDQIAKFDPAKKVQGLKEQSSANVNSLDKSLVKPVSAIDLYNPLESLRKIAASKKSKKGLKSAILPVNYPSVRKTYYQLTTCDGARLAGWIKIANRIPQLVQLMYQNAFKIKYHIEVPISHFVEKFGAEVWEGMTTEEKENEKTQLLQKMDNFLTQEDGGYSSFVSFFQVDQIKQTDYGRIKIEPIKDTGNNDAELFTGSAADIQFLIAAGINPTLFGAGTIGTGQQRSGGSDLREAFLIYCAGLALERQLLLSPLYLVRDFNKWDPKLVFRFTDTVLTTLDTGGGTTKKLS